MLKKEIAFDDYKKRLFLGKDQMRKMNIIRRCNHEIFPMKKNEIALSANDEKHKVPRRHDSYFCLR